MDDKAWYYNYFKKFVDTPAVPARSQSSHAFAEIPLPREKEGDAGDSSRAPETVTKEPSVASNSPAAEGSTRAEGREKVLFGKAPPALLAVIRRPGKATRSDSLDSSSIGISRKRGVDKVDGKRDRQSRERVKGKPRLTDVYPGLAKFK
jgi:hypothetical protein